MNKTKILFLSTALFILSGCGQTGPLYLPAKPHANPNQRLAAPAPKNLRPQS